MLAAPLLRVSNDAAPVTFTAPLSLMSPVDVTVSVPPIVEAARFVALLLNNVTLPAPVGANVIGPLIELLPLPRLICAAASVEVKLAVPAVTGCVCVIAPLAEMFSVFDPTLTPLRPLAVPMISGALFVNDKFPFTSAASVPTLF